MSETSAREAKSQTTARPAGGGLTEFVPELPVPERCNGMVALQRSAGNRAVNFLIDSNLKISSPGDRFEQEADKAADAVTVNSRSTSEWTNGHGVDKASTEATPNGNGSSLMRLNDHSASRAAQSSNAINDQLPQPVQQTLSATGEPLDRDVRSRMESRFGVDFSGVRIHTDSAAAESAQAVNALAYTVGRDVVFGSGQYQPRTHAGDRMIAHELAHVLQQGSATSTATSPATENTEARSESGPQLSLSSAPASIQREEPPGAEEPVITVGLTQWNAYWVEHVPSIDEVLDAAVELGAVDEAILKASKVQQVRPGKGNVWELKLFHPSKGEVATFRAFRSAYTGDDAELKGKQLFFVSMHSNFPAKPKDPTAQGKTGGGTPGTDKPGQPGETPKTPGPGTKGGTEEGKKKEGETKKGAEGGTGQEKKETPPPPVAQPADKKEPEEELPNRDYNELLKDNPRWQTMSKADRKLLDEYAKLSGEDLSKKGNIGSVNTDIKLSIALKLSSSWPAEVAEAAKAAFTDPAFVIMLVVTLAIYVGLWLVPDPSFITKALAGTLTAVLLLQFAWEDIYGLAKAWFDLETRCKLATTIDELKAAGDQFSRKVGSVGFDILLFIATWGLGKAAGPRIAKVGAARGVKTAEVGVAGAETKVAAAEGKPGSGAAQPATPEAAKLIDQAKTNAKGTTSTAVLDALADLLPKTAREGLRNFRDSNPSAESILRTLDGINRSGKDITKFLADKGVTPEAKRAVKVELEQAKVELAKSKLKLARAKLIESRTIKDATLRKAVREQQYSTIKALLNEIGAMEGTELSKAIKAGDANKVITEVRRILEQAATPKVAETQGAVGEAMQRAKLEAKYAKRKGITFLNNIAVIRRVTGYRTITEWRVAEEARIKAAEPDIDPAKLKRMLSRGAARYFEYDGHLWESVGEIDAVVAEPGAKGKLRPVELAEVKAGGQQSASDAAAQLDAAATGLKQIGAGAGADLKIVELSGKKTVAADLTEAFDLSNVDSAQKTTVGPKESAFPEQLDLTAEELTALAQSLMQNLPPAGPQTIPPTSLPRKEESPPPP